MKYSLLYLILLCSCYNVLLSQDIIYTSNGEKIIAKVLEINPNDIRYKNFANLNGPVYIVPKDNIVLINYSNGTSEIINENPETIVPHNTETVKDKFNNNPDLKKKPLNLYYLYGNLISINALALANGDVTLMYDREFAKNYLSFSLLGGYNFNSRMGLLNAYIVDSHDKVKKNYDVGAALNFMPNNTKRAQYFVGLLAKYMSYTYDDAVTNINNQLVYRKANGNQVAIMLTNGWTYRVSSSFNFKFFASLGIPINNPTNRYDGFPKMYLGYCFGYRFQ